MAIRLDPEKLSINFKRLKWHEMSWKHKMTRNGMKWNGLIEWIRGWHDWLTGWLTDWINQWTYESTFIVCSSYLSAYRLTHTHIYRDVYPYIYRHTHLRSFFFWVVNTSSHLCEKTCWLSSGVIPKTLSFSFGGSWWANTSTGAFAWTTARRASCAWSMSWRRPTRRSSARGDTGNNIFLGMDVWIG